MKKSVSQDFQQILNDKQNKHTTPNVPVNKLNTINTHLKTKSHSEE